MVNLEEREGERDESLFCVLKQAGDDENKLLPRVVAGKNPCSD